MTESFDKLESFLLIKTLPGASDRFKFDVIAIETIVLILL
ncbi:hypothetical protein LEP1GSC045_1327 [Leptospira interrogans serovar Pomona str. Kennewicki LC82-25]|nr:hypothetical protein LEP1GSC045_1327 [Leptospira interrogans serovar Pomona str. Kennewicki LC82-25]EKN96446.1 hypothetical protein LEP1GSC014_0635 [Leptospira interrogans serovar Pomona str. Pomona]EKO71033.1 hypothetical protein LEP1GSC069_2396 [Leptospira interrogans serovar Canicola str. Fiocruz LV133]EMF34697.1 hypothetical protein LEP1GSC201_1331 [Leptospira interrogans serovar Pomona str. Fox 32256]EMI71022.1 hypothetical protein LEP1GSC200_1066 [Leptospira interrogans serovar Pomona 